MRAAVPRPEDLVRAHRFERPVKANWKAVIDNYLECYHCPTFAGAHVWPTLTLNFFGGRNDAVVLMLVKPLTVDTSLEVIEWFLPSRQLGPAEQADIDWVSNVLNEEDVRLCENVQRGMKSRGFYDGRLVVNQKRSFFSEHAVHAFQRRVLQALSSE